ncbi:MAG TPA: hypothetical protein VGD61_23570 [Pyrinomonadaceae bacterium]
MISAASNIVRIVSVMLFVLVTSATSQTIEKQTLTHLEKIRAIRARMFHRLSDEDLSDVVGTNSILNALYYREK